MEGFDENSIEKKISLIMDQYAGNLQFWPNDQLMNDDSSSPSSKMIINIDNANNMIKVLSTDIDVTG